MGKRGKNKEKMGAWVGKLEEEENRGVGKKLGGRRGEIMGEKGGFEEGKKGSLGGKMGF